MDNKSLIIEYENLLLNQSASRELSTYYFAGDTKEKEKTVILLCQYLITEIFHWDVKQAKISLTWDILQKFALDKIILKYITFPPGIDPKTDMFYLLHLCFPKEVRFDERAHVINIYTKVLNEESRFPKDFFEGIKGMGRACICLQHMISRYMVFHSIEELYDMFGDTKYINKVLTKYKLKKASSLLFHLPVDYLHYSLSENQRDEFLHQFYCFEKSFKDAQKQIRKNKMEAHNHAC